MTFWEFSEGPWAFFLGLTSITGLGCALCSLIDRKFGWSHSVTIGSCGLFWVAAWAHYSIEGGNGMWVAASLGVIGFVAITIVKLVLGHRERVRKMELDSEIVRSEASR